jgi:hypothetical protein
LTRWEPGGRLSRVSGNLIFPIIMAVLIVGGGLALFIGSFYVSPTSLTEDGHSLKNAMLIAGSIILGMSAMGIPIGLVLHASKRPERERLKQLETSGVNGQARLLRFEERKVSGTSDHSVLAVLTLEVTLPGREPYTVTRNEDVPLLYLGRLRPGEVVPVRVHPTQRDVMRLDWASSPAPEAGTAR